MRLSMKALWLAWLCCFLSVSSQAAERKLIWSDEFDGEDLDRSKWDIEMYYAGTTGPRYHCPYYASYTMDDEINVRRGKLRLSTNRRTVTNRPEAPGTFHFTQGKVLSRTDHTFGYFEICALFPSGKGLWPCLWLMPRRYAWPPEFDIAEWIAGKKLMHFGLAHGDAVKTHWDSYYNGEIDFTGDFHVFALDWQPGRATWYVDGRPVWEVTGDHVPREPMFLILENSVGSQLSQTGLPDDSTLFPNSLVVDWVRVWDRR